MEPEVNTIEERIKTILSDNLGYIESDIHPTDILVDDLGADSLDIVEIIMAVEEEFNIEISEKDAIQVVTVQELIDCVKKRIQAH